VGVMPETKTPQHVAIIMDGNGRWAEQRGLPRVAGHKQGAEAVERVVRAASDLGVKYLTLFAFSTENWGRPEQEVTDLMGLLNMYLRSKTADMHENGVRLKIIGDRTRLSKDILNLIDHAETLTQHNTKIVVQMALSYSGRWDMTQATQQIASKVAAGELAVENITEDTLAGFLSTAGTPEPDLIIRTSGEQRISNFLLWQGAYSEYFFTQTYWPDFDTKDLQEAFASYQQRERRFGKIATRAS
jgi:undecaprenyl diphosphate synthase